MSRLLVRFGRGFHMQDHMVFGLVWGVGRDWFGRVGTDHNYSTMTAPAKYIAHMPGAGGNLLTRVFSQSHSATLIESAQYPAGLATGQRHPIKTSWREFEQRWRPQGRAHGYTHGHAVRPPHSPWLRVTVTTREEWDWACANALWKNSTLAPRYLASDPDLPAAHHVPLRDLWAWDTLAAALAHAQTNPVNTHQRSLWRQWQSTWCPTPGQLPALHRKSAAMNEHLRPTYCQ